MAADALVRSSNVDGVVVVVVVVDVDAGVVVDGVVAVADDDAVDASAATTACTTFNSAITFPVDAMHLAHFSCRMYTSDMFKWQLTMVARANSASSAVSFRCADCVVVDCVVVEEGESIDANSESEPATGTSPVR